jgi:hypothetical protein
MAAISSRRFGSEKLLNERLLKCAESKNPTLTGDADRLGL